MALEWAPDNIQANCLAPGFFMTPLTEKGLWGDPHRTQWLTERIPMRRPGQPEELVGAALLLASPSSSYLTGQILNVDGGYLAGGSWLRENE
jgi:NAD(P)-dependent dehydrogenase (short-subunit alcohol dehydrogenase family)